MSLDGDGTGLFYHSIGTIFFLIYSRHIWDVPITSASSSFHLAYATKLMFLLAGFFTALSLLTFYYRLVRESDIKWFRNWLHATLVFNIGGIVPFLLTQIFVCV